MGRATSEPTAVRAGSAARLHDRSAAAEFYEQRYADGYMEDWPLEKKQRIVEVTRSLDLPESGEALDFGCGNGVLTAALRQGLPAGWRVYGTDISATAVENARRRHPGCTFFLAGDGAWAGKRFDLLFTHHVLEHVFDLTTALQDMHALVKPDATVLHILPCGNEGSLEHRICLLRKNGSDAAHEHRFFYEPEGHLRRLTTDRLKERYEQLGLSLVREYYANHHHGAIEWITSCGSEFVRLITDASLAVDGRARGTLTRLRWKLLLLWALRAVPAAVRRRLASHDRSARDAAILTLGLPLYFAGRTLDAHLKAKAAEEWRRRRGDRRGSEMYLVFARDPRAG